MRKQTVGWTALVIIILFILAIPYGIGLYAKNKLTQEVALFLKSTNKATLKITRFDHGWFKSTITFTLTPNQLTINKNPIRLNGEIVVQQGPIFLNTSSQNRLSLGWYRATGTIQTSLSKPIIKNPPIVHITLEQPFGTLATLFYNSNSDTTLTLPQQTLHIITKQHGTLHYSTSLLKGQATINHLMITVTEMDGKTRTLLATLPVFANVDASKGPAGHWDQTQSMTLPSLSILSGNTKQIHFKNTHISSTTQVANQRSTNDFLLKIGASSGAIALKNIVLETHAQHIPLGFSNKLSELSDAIKRGDAKLLDRLPALLANTEFSLRYQAEKAGRPPLILYVDATFPSATGNTFDPAAYTSLFDKPASNPSAAAFFQHMKARLALSFPKQYAEKLALKLYDAQNDVSKSASSKRPNKTKLFKQVMLMMLGGNLLAILEPQGDLAISHIEYQHKSLQLNGLPWSNAHLRLKNAIQRFLPEQKESNHNNVKK